MKTEIPLWGMEKITYYMMRRHIEFNKLIGACGRRHIKTTLTPFPKGNQILKF